jgi:hypothetical protein
VKPALAAPQPAARRAAEQARANGQATDGMEYAEAFKYFKLE